MQILQRVFRLHVETAAFEATIAFYEMLQGMPCERRVKISETGIEAAKVGGFLILSGSAEQLAPVRHVQAIFYVDSLDAFAARLREQGAAFLAGPHTVTSGRNATVRHPDGLVVEYFEAAKTV